MDHKEFLHQIEQRKVQVGVFGLGYVGLPLTKNLIDKGYSVIGYDPDKSKIDSLRAGRSYVEAVTDADVQRWGTRFKGISRIEDFIVDYNYCIYIACVPTPLNTHREPDLIYVESAARDIATAIKNSNKPALAVLESTTYPGTTKELFQPIIEKIIERKLGNNLYIAHAPEREDPGSQHFSTADIPRVVGADDGESLELASIFYKSLVPFVHSVSDTRVAEASKVIENSYRMINICFVNSLKEMFDYMGIDIWDVINAAKTKPFGFTPFYPGPGIGGHCIKIDPYYLTWKAKEFGFTDHFLELAADVNERMPRFVVRKLTEALNKFKKSVNGSKILIMGGAYKANIGDLRESAAFPIMEELEKLGANLIYHDPHCPEIKLHNGSLYQSKKDAMEPAHLNEVDCVLLVTNHSIFDYQLVADHARLIVDTRNVFADIKGTAIVVKA